MAKKKAIRSKDRQKSSTNPPAKGDQTGSAPSRGSSRATRETIESIAIALILAFLFRAFEAEAFVIPTGSMAPTLMGRHKDLLCEECFANYRAGSSCETPSFGPVRDVMNTVCPMCRNRTRNSKKESDHQSYSGDRILVSKFAYQFSEPERWDVIVFKYPGNAKQNYIKRLVGLPNETVRIRHGDIHTAEVADPQPKDFDIARKEPRKLRAMLQRVHDTNHIPPALVKQNWPSQWDWPERWKNPPPENTGEQQAIGGTWQTRNGGRHFEIDPGQADPKVPEASGIQWLRYRHLQPPVDWRSMIKDKSIEDEIQKVRADRTKAGRLITDVYAYNDTTTKPRPPGRPSPANWVGDLAVECELTVQNDSGMIHLDLVEGGRHYQCKIDVSIRSEGLATLSIDKGEVPFLNSKGLPGPTELTAKTAVQGPGSYRLRFANCDDQLTLWVNDWPIAFEDPQTRKKSKATYAAVKNVRPVWSEEDPGDLWPVGVGSNGVSLEIDRLRVLRDIYYIAVDSSPSNMSDYGYFIDPDSLASVFADPPKWSETSLFDDRQSVRFPLMKDQFFPLGDNTPSSQDGRLWTVGEKFVDRRYLTGKALFVYWPHGWDTGIPLVPNIIPNFGRMKFVR